MRRNVTFEKGRGWRVEDDQYRDLRLGPDRGAAPGEYAAQESSEFSDSYYGPGDEYARRSFAGGGYGRGEEDPGPVRNPRVGGVVGDVRGDRAGNRSYGEVRSYGELHGQRSWADLGVSSVRPGESGITDEPLPSFRGRGPKGYTRSDERLTEVVCDRLSHDPHIDASDITVQVSNGEVTLTGTVSDRSTKWRAEDAVESCGVATVHNRLRMRSDHRSGGSAAGG